MPELPDVTIYVEALESRIIGRAVEHVRVLSPFVLRTFDPPIDAIIGAAPVGIARLGKRIVIEFGPAECNASPDRPLFLVIHLMIAGRLRWFDAPPAKPPTIALAQFDFDDAALLITEAGSKKRASIHVVAGREALAAHDPGGLEPLDADRTAFAAALRRENRTLKRALTDPRLFSGIGNAYSDEILHAAGLSPIMLTSRLTDDQIDRLHAATRDTLIHWTDLLRRQFAGRFPGPGQITAFRPDFAVHGKFGQPCPVCGAPVQRIRYAENEVNYCATCQTGGKVLADRSLSRLLKNDWPRSIEQLE
jgi:formamidopyrimidine-DNA glycosylase